MDPAFEDDVDCLDDLAAIQELGSASLAPAACHRLPPSQPQSRAVLFESPPTQSQTVGVALSSNPGFHSSLDEDQQQPAKRPRIQSPPQPPWQQQQEQRHPRQSDSPHPSQASQLSLPDPSFPDHYHQPPQLPRSMLRPKAPQGTVSVRPPVSPDLPDFSDLPFDIPDDLRIPGPAGKLLERLRRLRKAGPGTAAAAALGMSEELAAAAAAAVAAEPQNFDGLSQEDSQDVDFESHAWKLMLEYLGIPPELDGRDPARFHQFWFKHNISWILRGGFRAKVPHIVVYLREFDMPADGTDATAVFKDRFGQMKGTIHRQVVEEIAVDMTPTGDAGGGGHCALATGVGHPQGFGSAGGLEGRNRLHSGGPTLLSKGCVLVLRNVSIFNPGPTNHYLNVTVHNLVGVFCAPYSPVPFMVFRSLPSPSSASSSSPTLAASSGSASSSLSWPVPSPPPSCSGVATPSGHPAANPTSPQSQQRRLQQQPPIRAPISVASSPVPRALGGAVAADQDRSAVEGFQQFPRPQPPPFNQAQQPRVVASSADLLAILSASQQSAQPPHRPPHAHVQRPHQGQASLVQVPQSRPQNQSPRLDPALVRSAPWSSVDYQRGLDASAPLQREVLHPSRPHQRPPPSPVALRADPVIHGPAADAAATASPDGRLGDDDDISALLSGLDPSDLMYFD